MKVGFIGAGKLGTMLGRYFVSQGIGVTGYFSAHESSARMAATRASTHVFRHLSELISASDIIFTTVTDDALAAVWKQLCNYPIRGKILCHCSGCLSSRVFAGASQWGAVVCSAHPLIALSDPCASLQYLRKAPFTLEGDQQALHTVGQLLSDLGNPVYFIKGTHKTRYHAAAVFASNMVLAPLGIAVQLMQQCGFSQSEAREVLTPLIEGNVRAFCENGAVCALTGPVERNDTDTVKGHLNQLDDETAQIYRSLSKTLLKLAQEKHPERDYSTLQASIEKR